MWYKNEYFVTLTRSYNIHEKEFCVHIFAMKTQTADNLSMRCEMSCQQDGDGGYYSATNIKLLSDVTTQLPIHKTLSACQTFLAAIWLSYITTLPIK